MIYTFYGTQQSKNYAPMLLAACAFETAYIHGRKTLVLQFHQNDPVEDLLLGSREIKDIRDMDSDDTGIDTLLRKVRSKGLKDEHFTTYTKQILSKREANNFDVATVAKLEDFQAEVLEHPEDIRELLERADMLYDCIYVLASGLDDKMIEILAEASDKKIVCVKQGERECYPCADGGDILLVPRYDELSFFNLKYLKKAYGTKNIFTIPYNIGFQDACVQNKILKFLYENNDVKDDVNGAFIKVIKNITSSLLDVSKMEEEKGFVAWDFKKLQKQQEEIEKMTLKPEQVVVEKKKKKGLFAKKKTVIEINTENTNEN